MEFKSVGIKGMGYYVPERIMSNFDFEKILDTSDEWIRTMTGVEERRFAAPEEATSDLCVKAAEKALKVAGMTIEDIDMIIVATVTPDYPVQSAACLVQHKMGARNVLISMAGDGAILIKENGKVITSNVPKGKVKNSVGAGDSMVAGFIAGYLEANDIERGFKLGVATGSASAFSEGLATKDYVYELLNQIN